MQVFLVQGILVQVHAFKAPAVSGGVFDEDVKDVTAKLTLGEVERLKVRHSDGAEERIECVCA